MTIQTTDNYVEYVGDGVLTDFDFSFTAFDEDTIYVYEGGQETTRPFTVTLNDDQTNTPGGTVAFDAPIDDGVMITIARVLELLQPVDYRRYGPFPAETHERALDNLTMQMQQVSEATSRAMRFPLGDTSNVVLPDKETRANKYQAFDANGDVVAVEGTSAEPNAVQKPESAVTAGNLMAFDSQKNAVDSGISIEDIFPVGALYFGPNPNNKLPGTWTQVPEGTFFMSTVGGSDPSGGSNDAVVVEHSHSLSINNSTTHGHDVRYGGLAADNGVDSNQRTLSLSGGATAELALPAGTHDHSGTATTTGEDGTGKNRPQYIGLEVWQRTA